MATEIVTPRPSVGFIGLGDQGLPMATAIAEAGYPLQVWPDPATRRPAATAGLVQGRAGLPPAF